MGLVRGGKGRVEFKAGRDAVKAGGESCMVCLVAVAS